MDRGKVFRVEYFQFGLEEFGGWLGWMEPLGTQSSGTSRAWGLGSLGAWGLSGSTSRSEWPLGKIQKLQQSFVPAS